MFKGWRNIFKDAIGQDHHLETLQEKKDRELGRKRAVEEAERKASLDRTPIKPDQWIDNEYFCGSFARTMYPKLKEHFVKIIESGAHEILLGGATRYGKTTLAIALEGRSKYEVNCLVHPQRAFHLQDESVLLYLNMNVTDAKARDAYFSRLSTWIRSTAYFQREFPPKQNLIHRLEFPKRVLCRYAGANRKAAESEDLFFFVGDEANLYDVVEKSKRSYDNDKYDAAEDINTAVDLRMRGTFRRADGSYPPQSRVIWLCKETYPDSFMRRKIEKARRENEEESGYTYIVESTEWDMKPRRCPRCEEIIDENQHECHCCGDRIHPIEYFWIRTSDRLESAKIVTEEDEAGKLKREAERRGSRPEDERFSVLDVPMVYFRDASAGPGALESFLRDMAGVPTRSIMRFIQDKQVIVRALRRPHEPTPGMPTCLPELCRHPMNMIATNTKDGAKLIPGWLANRKDTGQIDTNGKLVYVWEPYVNSSAPRFIGIDAGLSGDAMGFAMGHCAGFTEVQRQVYDENQDKTLIVTEKAPVHWFDLVLQIKPPPGGQIPFAWARGLVYKLSRLGFHILKITCDSFQHVAITQPLEERGYECEVVSVDRTPDAYNLLRQAFEEWRVSMYDYHPVVEELGNLEKIVTGTSIQGRAVEKVDHPPSSSKDVSDAMAQVSAQIEGSGVPADITEYAHQVEWANKSKMVEEAKHESSKQEAFERGDFEKLMDIVQTEEDDLY